MRTRKVNRYYCEFCKKSGGSAPHMAQHERHCTMNPNRECRVCKIIGQLDHPVPVKDLLAILPEPIPQSSDLGSWINGEATNAALAEVMPKIREMVYGCPACIMAALRQKGIPVRCVEGFNYTKEMEQVWQEFNESQRKDEQW